MFLTRLSSRDWVFAAKTFAASMLALYIALAAGLPRPYWAMATVYIVANPLSGATRSKALFRVGGTVIGACAAVFFLPLFVNQPLMMSIVVALWTGSLLFVSFLDRSPRSYLFMLSGYTLPLIALPAVGNPAQVFDIAVARAQEIALGIICASVLNSLILPVRVGPVVGGRVSQWLNDARGWIRASLSGDGKRDEAAASARLAGDITALDALISQLAYDPAMVLVVRHARALRARMAILLPILSSLTDRLDAVRDAGAMTPRLEALVGEVDAFIATDPADPVDGEGPSTADTLIARLTEAQIGDLAQASWPDILTASALQRMKEAVDLWQDCSTLRREVLAGRKARRRPAPLRMTNIAPPVPHYDLGLMVFSAGSAVLATIAASLVWIYSGWDQGAAFVMIAAVACSFFATADAPVPLLQMFIKWTVVATVLAGVYVFAILPHVHTFPGLVAVFFLPFMFLGLLITQPPLMMIGMLMGVNLATLMSLQEVYSANFESFANGGIATVGGGVFALVWMSVTRPFGAALAARRLVRAGWSSLADAARSQLGGSPALFTSQVFDRLGQLVPRLAQGVTLDVTAADVVTEMRVGLNVINLKMSGANAAEAVRPHVVLVLDKVADLFERRASSGRKIEADADLLERIDAGIRACVEAEVSESRRVIVAALVGLRRALFPQAPAPLLASQPVREEPVLLAAE